MCAKKTSSRRGPWPVDRCAAAPLALSSSHFGCLQDKGELTLLSVSVVPNARRTEAVGLHDRALRIRLAAPPVDGKANDTLCHWVADQLGLPKRGVTPGAWP